ncbi:MAG: glycosyltransferase family 87 protein, partial [Candidatus Omnitrophota bacterium]
MRLIVNAALAVRRFFISKTVFSFIIVSFIVSLGWVIHIREGKDLKVGLFGVEQVLQKKSPYENPTDPNRTIYRYAPGITILQYPFLMQSKSIRPFYYKDITPSALAWYFTVLASLFLSLRMLLKLIPSSSRRISIDNLKVSLLLALPFIGYELSNGQNKLLSLFFTILALYLFEKKRFFPAAVSFCVGLTIYIALFPFLFYFLIRKKAFILHFLFGVLVVFFIVPSFFFGFHFNNFLLGEWFRLALKPFFFTDSYTSYIDLRHSNQAMPGAIGRIFVSGNTEGFRYAVSPLVVHLVVRFFSAVFVLFSIFAVWKNKQEARRGLAYAVFFILPLVLPLYCIYYTWAWVLVLYYAIFNYIDSGAAS